MTLSTYTKRDLTPVSAIQLPENLTEFRYQKWGDHQKAKPGDWLITNGDDTYSVDKESFAKTYTQVGESQFIKTAIVWAEETEVDGDIKTKEGITHYKKGDYLVYNDPDRLDGYAVKAKDFLKFYKPTETQMNTKISTTSEPQPHLNLQQYLKHRVDAQIEWYENKAAANKRLYTKLQVASILCGSMVPILTVVTFDRAEFVIRLLIALLGSAVAVISAITTLHKFEDNWVKYRTAAQLLMREKQFLLTQTKPYNTENAFSIFVQNCEAILAAENSQWHQMFSAKTEKDESKGN